MSSAQGWRHVQLEQSSAQGRIGTRVLLSCANAAFDCSQEIRGFYHQQAGMLPQQLEARLSSAQAVDPAHLAAGAAETTSATHSAAPAGRGSSSISSSSWQAASAAAAAAGAGAGAADDDADHAVLRPMQVQQHVPAGDAATSSAAGLRPSRQRQQQEQAKSKQQQQQQEQAKSKQQQQPLLQQVVQQEQQAEALTPRAARLQRRLQQQQQQAQQHSQHDAENTHPTARGVSDAAGGDAGQKAQAISAEEFSQLPSWCKSLLTADLLNGVLLELSELSATRWGGQVCCTTVQFGRRVAGQACLCLRLHTDNGSSCRSRPKSTHSHKSTHTWHVAVLHQLILLFSPHSNLITHTIVTPATQ